MPHLTRNLTPPYNCLFVLSDDAVIQKYYWGPPPGRDNCSTANERIVQAEFIGETRANRRPCRSSDGKYTPKIIHTRWCHFSYEKTNENWYIIGLKAFRDHQCMWISMMEVATSDRFKTTPPSRRQSVDYTYNLFSNSPFRRVLHQDPGNQQGINLICWKSWLIIYTRDLY